MARLQTAMKTVAAPVSGALSDATEGVHNEWLYVVNDTSNDSTTVYTGPVLVAGIFVNTVLSAHTVVIQDGSTAVITLPASLAAGTWMNFGGIRFDTSLVINPNDSSTGNITVFYRPL